MTLAICQQMVVDQDHAIHLQSLELKPGSKVEVIVLMKNEIRHTKEEPVSFLEEAQKLFIDAPPDFSTAFEKNLYGHGN